MVRAGFVRQLAAGLYIYLPLGIRVMEKINRIIREEMNAIGGQEVTMPVLNPAEVWQQTGRWDAIGDEMFRLKDRGGRDMCLAMTHEETMTWLAAHDIRSYRELPQIWYQLQTKLRDEARPKSGVLRTREFTMKDSYSFDADEAGLDRSYQLHLDAYKKIYTRCGIRFHVVQSDTGMMGGSMAHEYMAPSPGGRGRCGALRRLRLRGEHGAGLVRAEDDRRIERRLRGDRHAGAADHRRGDAVPEGDARPAAQVHPRHERQRTGAGAGARRPDPAREEARQAHRPPPAGAEGRGEGGPRRACRVHRTHGPYDTGRSPTRC